MMIQLDHKDMKIKNNERKCTKRVGFLKLKAFIATTSQYETEMFHSNVSMASASPVSQSVFCVLGDSSPTVDCTFNITQRNDCLVDV